MKNLLIAAIVICILVIAYSSSPTLKTIAMPLMFFICGLGLCLEARKIYNAGEVKARVKRGWERSYRERLHQDGFVKYIIIKRDAEPLRFHFYVIAYGIFGTFSLVASAFYLFVIYKHQFVLV